MKDYFGPIMLGLALLSGSAAAGFAEQDAAKTDAEVNAALERCASEYKELEAVLKAAQNDVERHKADYEKDSSPENEQALLAAVDTQVEAMVQLAPKEHECNALLAEQTKRSATK